MPFFSIIIPTFNSEKDISRCCLSILSQTFKDYEIIIRDGLSTDETLTIVTQIKNSNLGVPIHIFSEMDSGIYDAMNKGVRSSSGKRIYFLGSDDVMYDENVFQQIFKECNKSNADVVYGNVLSKRLNGLSGIYDGEFTNDKLFEKNICHQAIFMKKIVFNKIGYFNIKYKAHSDWDHNMRWFLSDQISKKHVDIIVSKYSDDGFSSTYGDTIFEKDKVLKYLILSRSKLKLSVKLKMIRSLTGYALLIKDYKLIGRIIFYSPIILL